MSLDTFQALPGDPVAQAWREMLEDAVQWSIAFTLDDFIKVGYWRSEPTQAKVKSLQDAVEQAAADGKFEGLK